VNEYNDPSGPSCNQIGKNCWISRIRGCLKVSKMFPLQAGEETVSALLSIILPSQFSSPHRRDRNDTYETASFLRHTA
jgi:hypothetical protein